MTKHQLVFDSNIIYKLIRETPEAASEILSQGATIYLAYYELGNALWREALLFKRISLKEAQKSLDLMYQILDHMEVAPLADKSGSEVLDTAYTLNLTFYDSAYLTEAKKTGKTLVTDDNKLALAAKNLGIQTLSSKTLQQ